MIATCVIGYSITPEYLAKNPHLKFAKEAKDTGVIISYNTEAPQVADKKSRRIAWRHGDQSLPGPGEKTATAAESLGFCG